MAETPIGFFPDVRCQWGMQYIEDHATEILTARGGREQRRGFFSANGYRRFSAPSDALNQSDRQAVKNFLRARRGKLDAFNFFNPIPELYTDASIASITAKSKIILPYKGSTVTDVRVAEVSQSFTVLPLLPRPTTFAALRFYGAGDYVTCGSSATLRPAGDFTMAAWVFPAAIGTAMLIGSNWTNNASGMFLSLSTTGAIRIITAQAGVQTIADSTTLVAANTWTHVAAVLATNSVTFYINGVQKNTVAAINPAVTATVPFTISDVTNSFLGMIQDLRVYTTSLTAGSIANIYNGTVLPSSTLHGWWLLTEGTGLTAADSSGTGNTGSLIGTPAPVWVGGEDEVTFSGGAQTGNITATLTGRERMICRSDLDSYAQSFMANATDVRSIFTIAVKEVY